MYLKLNPENYLPNVFEKQGIGKKAYYWKDRVDRVAALLIERFFYSG